MKHVAILAATAAALLTAGQASAATLFSADNLSNGVLSGVVELDAGSLSETGSFLTSGHVAGLAADSSSVYASLPDGISKYDLSGALQASYANVGIDSFGALAVFGSTLFAADNLTNGVLSGVVELDTSSLNEMGSFITSGHVAGIATDGVNIYASLPDGISEYSFDGTFENMYANVGIDNFEALSFANGYLYAADNLTNGVLSGVVILDGSLSEVSSFITDGHVAGLASDGSNVFASLPNGITQYTTSGDIVNSYPNVGIDSFGALALAPEASSVPEPTTWAMMVMGFGIVGFGLRARRKVTTRVAFA